MRDHHVHLAGLPRQQVRLNPVVLNVPRNCPLAAAVARFPEVGNAVVNGLQIPRVRGPPQVRIPGQTVEAHASDFDAGAGQVVQAHMLGRERVPVGVDLLALPLRVILVIAGHVEDRGGVEFAADERLRLRLSADVASENKHVAVARRAEGRGARHVAGA